MSAQPLFRVFINSNLITEPDGSVNEPEGLLTAVLKIVRDENLKGIFFEYVTPLTFSGAAYDFIHTLYQNNDDCVKIDVRIDYQCAQDSGYATLFEGQIPLGSDEVEWDDYNCRVTTKLENADFSNFLQKFGDFKIKINSSFCIDGISALAPITPVAVDPFNGFLGGLSGVPTLCYEYIALLQQCLSYLSNNEITLVPDPLYSTVYVPQQIVWTLNPGPAAAPTLTFENYFGQNRGVTGLSDLDQFVAALLHKTHDNTTPYEDRDNLWEKASYSERAGLGITVLNYLPWRSWNLTYPNGVASEVVIPEVYGLKNLYVTTNTALQGQNIQLNITLNQLLKHAAEFSNMGYRLTKSGSGYNFNLLKVETLLDSSSDAISVTNVRNITHKSSGEFNLVALTTPDGKADDVFKKQSYNTGNCYGDNLTLDGKNYSSQEIFDYLVNTQKQDDDLVFMFLDNGDLTKAQEYSFRFQVDSGGLPASSAIYVHYNAPYFQGLIARRYNINTGLREFKTEIPLQGGDFSTCSNCPAAAIENTVTDDLKRLYVFDAPVSYEQITAIRDNSLQMINFTDNTTLNKDGFIKQLEIPFLDFIAHFEVYASST